METYIIVLSMAYAISVCSAAFIVWEKVRHKDCLYVWDLLLGILVVTMPVSNTLIMLSFLCDWSRRTKVGERKDTFEKK